MREGASKREVISFGAAIEETGEAERDDTEGAEGSDLLRGPRRARPRAVGSFRRRVAHSARIISDVRSGVWVTPPSGAR